MVNTDEQASVALAVVVALPFLLTMTWIARLHAATMAHRGRGKAIAMVLYAVVAMVAVAAWSHDAMKERAEEPHEAGRYAGCYELRIGGWLPSTMRHEHFGIVPERIRLDTVRRVPPPAGSELRSDTWYRNQELGERMIRPGWWGAAFWAPLEGDFTRLVWTTGLGGVVMDLQPRGRELRGVARAFTDVRSIWPSPRARVRALPVDCALVARDSAR